MTAEVALMNKEAVAIAADSAATVRDETGQKIFSSANKIFALSKYSPVGIMIYGSASFMGVPWETIVKEYRRNLKRKKFNHLNQYSNDFINYLRKQKSFFPKEEQHNNYLSSVFGYFKTVIRSEIENQIENAVRVKGEISEKEVKDIVKKVIKNQHEKFKSAQSVVKNPKETILRIISSSKNEIKSIKAKVFEKLPLSNIDSRYLTEIAANLPIKFPDGISHSGISGIVIAGFGENEIFPSLDSFTVEGVYHNILKHRHDKSRAISFDTNAMIVPFAQHEMVYTFMEGVNPRYDKILNDILKHAIRELPLKILNEIKSLSANEKNKINEKMIREGIKRIDRNITLLDDFRRDNFVDPIIKVVAFLPKDELAAMAEALVNLTCLKKRITMEDETVGGPIDVAVISKGDGLIWIRRKHYFKAELNRQYFQIDYNQS